MPLKKFRKTQQPARGTVFDAEPAAAPMCRPGKIRKVEIAGALRSGLADEQPEKIESSHPELQNSCDIQDRYAALSATCPKLAAKIAAWRTT